MTLGAAEQTLDHHGFIDRVCEAFCNIETHGTKPLESFVFNTHKVEIPLTLVFQTGKVGLFVDMLGDRKHCDDFSFTICNL